VDIARLHAILDVDEPSRGELETFLERFGNESRLVGQNISMFLGKCTDILPDKYCLVGE
jgi:hypothetical protein